MSAERRRADDEEAHFDPETSAQWREDCLRWRGRVLVGRYAHWCFDWDELPVDETCSEWPCPCKPELETCKCKRCATLVQWEKFVEGLAERVPERARFDEVLAKIPDVPPVPGDEKEDQ